MTQIHSRREDMQRTAALFGSLFAAGIVVFLFVRGAALVGVSAQTAIVAAAVLGWDIFLFSHIVNRFDIPLPPEFQEVSDS